MEFVNIILFAINFISVIADMCPKQCDCDMADGLNRAKCTDQNIVTVDVGVPKEVQIYILSNNVISELDNYVFKEVGYISLQVLNLSYNHIFWIGLHAFAGLTRLYNLNLSSNRLSYLAPDLFWETPKLENLDLSGNIFENLKNEPFLTHENIKMLNLRNSRIKSLPERMFKRLTNLRKLDLSENYMISLSMEVLTPMNKLERLELRNEYWKCTKEFMSIESLIVSRNIVYQKHCKKLQPKMSEKMISAVVNETEVDTDNVWNTTKSTDTNLATPPNQTSNLTPFEKFDRDFPASQSFILGLEIGVALGVLGTYIWLRCNCRKLSCRMPETRRQRLRRERVENSEISSNLLWAYTENPTSDTPPTMRRQMSLPDIVTPLPTYGLHSITEASDLFDIIRPGRCETPPPPYHECRLQIK